MHISCFLFSPTWLIPVGTQESLSSSQYTSVSRHLLRIQRIKMLVAKIELKKKFTQVKKVYNAHIEGDLPKFMETGFQGKKIMSGCRCVCVFHQNKHLFNSFPQSSCCCLGRRTMSSTDLLAKCGHCGEMDQVRGTPWEPFCPTSQDLH